MLETKGKPGRRTPQERIWDSQWGTGAGRQDPTDTVTPWLS